MFRPGKLVTRNTDHTFEARFGAFRTPRFAVGLACVAVAGLILGVATLAAASAPSFASPRSYATGTAPYSVAMSD
jgi:hypothetical protein